jgi:hypothetical protein
MLGSPHFAYVVYATSFLNYITDSALGRLQWKEAGLFFQ